MYNLSGMHKKKQTDYLCLLLKVTKARDVSHVTVRNDVTYDAYYSPEAKYSFGRIMEILDGVHAFGYKLTPPQVNRFGWNLEHIVGAG